MMNKKAIANWIIITTIISLIFLLTYSYYINDFITNSKYETSKIQCSQIFNLINKNPNTYFIGDRGKLNLEKILTNNCDSGEYEIENEKIQNAKKAILDCFQKTSNQINIIPSSQTSVRTICLQCGIINTNEKIENFNEKLLNELKEETKKLTTSKDSAKNLNEIFLLNEMVIPETINEDEKIILTYFITKVSSYEDEKTKFEKIKNLIDTGINLFSSQAENVITGMSLLKISKSNSNNFNGKDTILNCDEFYIPTKTQKIN